MTIDTVTAGDPRVTVFSARDHSEHFEKALVATEALLVWKSLLRAAESSDGRHKVQRLVVLARNVRRRGLLHVVLEEGHRLLELLELADVPRTQPFAVGWLPPRREIAVHVATGASQT